jgi:hypothetical protein
MVGGPTVGDLSPAAIPIGRFQSKGVCAMKLTSAQVERALGQIEAQPIPDDHPVVAELNELFGEHTFFLDSNGLNIIEPAVGTGAGVQSAELVNLASWNEDDGLEPHEPEATNVIIVLESRH